MSFAQELTLKNGLISPTRYALALNLTPWDLADMAGRVDVQAITENPENALLQGFLRRAVSVLDAALVITPDRKETLRWFRETSIPELGGLTPEALIANKKTHAVLVYVKSKESGHRSHACQHSQNPQ